MAELDEQYNNLFNQQGDLTAEGLWAYTHGGLDADAMSQAQQHIAGCDMCQDAAEGAAMLNDKMLYFSSINALNQKIDEEVKKKKKPAFILPYQRMAIAALLLLLLGVSFIWFNYREEYTAKQTVAQSEQKNNEPQFRNPNALNESAPPASPNAITKSDTSTSYLTFTNTTSNGSATGTASGGNAPYTYNWQSSPSSGAAQPNVPAGAYTVTVTDANGSQASQAEVLDDKQDAKPTTMADSVVLSANSVGATYRSAPAAKESKNLDLKKKDERKERTDKAKGATVPSKKNLDSYSYSGDNTTADTEKAEEVASDNIEQQYPGSTDYIQHYVDSLRPNKTKASRYPITVKLTFDMKGEISTVDFAHAPGINAKEKGELENVLKSMPFWKARKKPSSRLKKLSVTFKY